MPIKYCCNHCEYSSATQHYVNHLVSKHKDELFNEKTKYSILGALKGKSLPVLNIKIKDDATKHDIRVCFGCNKFWQRGNLAVAHLAECTNKTKHINFLKSLTDDKTANDDNANAIITANADNANADNAEISALNAKILKMQKKIASLEQQEEIEQINLKAFDSFMMFLLEKKDEEFRDTLRDELQEYNPDIDWTEHL